jgi:hypothetical protein
MQLGEVEFMAPVRDEQNKKPESLESPPPPLFHFHVFGIPKTWRFSSNATTDHPSIARPRAPFLLALPPHHPAGSGHLRLPRTSRRISSACRNARVSRNCTQLLGSKSLRPRLSSITCSNGKDLAVQDCATALLQKLLSAARQRSCVFRREIIHITRKPFGETNHEKPVRRRQCHSRSIPQARS